MKKGILNFVIFTFMLLNFSCSFKNFKKTNPAPFSKRLLIPESALEKANCLNPSSILICEDGIFLGSKQESTIAKFTLEGKPVKKYNHTGQGPGEFDGFFNISLYKDYIAIFTAKKIVILDKDLNFVREFTLTEFSYFSNPFYMNNTFYGTTIKKDKWVIELLNDNLKVIDEIPVNNEIPFNWNKVRNLFFFYAFHPLFSKMIITSGVFFNNVNCKFKVMDLKTKKITDIYSWTNNNFKTTENDIKQLKNFYSFSTIAETENFYILENSFSKNVKAKNEKLNQTEWIIFDKKSKKIVYRNEKNPLSLIPLAYDYVNKDRFYAIDDKGIYVCKMKMK